MTRVCVEVFGNDEAVAFAGSQCNFQLNVFKPVMVHNVLKSIALLSDACASFNEHCAAGMEPNRERIAENLEKNLMLVTALNRHIGYDKAAFIAKKAQKEKSTLREAALSPGYEIGRAHVRTPVTNAHLVCRLLLAKKHSTSRITL